MGEQFKTLSGSMEQKELKQKLAMFAIVCSGAEDYWEQQEPEEGPWAFRV